MTEAPAPSVSPHVLLVEDDWAIGALFEDVLAEEGYRVTLAINGEKALEIDARLPADLLVTDLRMPGMTGRELAQRMRARHPDLPIVVVSGLLEEAGDLGRDGAPTVLLQKPVDTSALVRHVAMLLHRPG
ncbi:response regulator [Arenibaculum pallidiluteum]|uniref:response regulator n=1 Tax=Arenibaculum pallidiluteum TaxID=2812559 RepID=UPI001A971221|nr:response regulator [Arenibaculum pallidiluteum]